MEIQETDLTDRIHKETLLEKIRSEPRNVARLLKWSTSTKQPLGWRATWLLKQLVAKNDPQLKEHIGLALDRFPSFNESQKREWLRTLINQEWTEEEEGLLYDLCMIEWKNIHNHPALRSSAFQILFIIITKFPELINELTEWMLPEYLESLSPAIKKGILKQWNSL